MNLIWKSPIWSLKLSTEFRKSPFHTYFRWFRKKQKTNFIDKQLEPTIYYQYYLEPQYYFSWTSNNNLTNQDNECSTTTKTIIRNFCGMRIWLVNSNRIPLKSMEWKADKPASKNTISRPVQSCLTPTVAETCPKMMRARTLKWPKLS